MNPVIVIPISVTYIT